MLKTKVEKLTPHLNTTKYLSRKYELRKVIVPIPFCIFTISAPAPAPANEK